MYHLSDSKEPLHPAGTALCAETGPGPLLIAENMQTKNKVEADSSKKSEPPIKRSLQLAGKLVTPRSK